jgi:membrane associated rhomboid family serine protease
MKSAAGFVIAIWLVFLINLVVPIELNDWGVRPRSLAGIVGVATSPLLHANLQHIVSNTIPVFVLMVLLGATNRHATEIVVACVLLGGGLLWVFGRPANHIGASGLVYALAACLVVSGIRSRKIPKTLAAVVVVVLYGGLVWRVVPTETGVSWDGHLLGAIGGGIIGWLEGLEGPKPKAV